ncbi:MAG: acireductone synthase [Desulfobacteraceae bacterium]|nr:acireductone synthase [Desulfobacteraceae bacterium]
MQDKRKINSIKAILLDIEGTISSISFVKNVLFPYARNHLRSYINQHKNDIEVKRLLCDVDEVVGQKLTTEEQIKHLIQWTNKDKKITPLKAIQGLIWEFGYRNGEYKGHVYKDAMENIQAWYKKGLSLYIFSSGSVFAQKLFFSHTEYGDITPLFTGFFDTTTGAKEKTSSYRYILKELEYGAFEVLFLSDSQKELDAAHQACMQTCLVVRDANINLEEFAGQIKNFNQIIFE